MIKNNKGFTLVELMVVLLIIAILIAVAVPVFLGVRNRGYDNAIKQALTNASRAAAAKFAADGAWPADPTGATNSMEAEEDAYTYAAAAVVGSASNQEGTLGYTTAAGVMTLTGISRSTDTFTTSGTATGGLTRSW